MDKKLEVMNINWDTIDNMLEFDVTYDKATDILFMQTKENRPAISIDCDGEYWIRVDPQSGEILGIEIEDFKSVFLKKHPELAKETTAFVRPIADLLQLEKCAA
ncbi:DUF2283 domain-containing protein [Chloroflexota bacterium]